MRLAGQTQILLSPREITQLISGELLYHKESERSTTSLPLTVPIVIRQALPSACNSTVNKNLTNGGAVHKAAIPVYVTAFKKWWLTPK